MKLSEIRPCDNCGGAIAPNFYVVDVSLAMLKPQATNQVLGLVQMFGGSLALAEAMSPDAEAALVMGDEDRTLRTRLVLCTECLAGRPANIGQLVGGRDGA